MLELKFLAQKAKIDFDGLGISSFIKFVKVDEAVSFDWILRITNIEFTSDSQALAWNGF